MTEIISKNAIERRKYWINEIKSISGKFGDESLRVQNELSDEIKKSGVNGLIDHLRLSGDIPEVYGRDTSEEKQYSKYTDALLCEAYKSIGMKSIVLTERGDVADVEGYAENYSFVADAKAFRLSRTAKNQKDFKVQALDGWKHGKPYAMVVCPIYQLPTRSSQIYQQASTRNVCIFTYSHLAMLVLFAKKEGREKAEELLENIFKSISRLNPSKDAVPYWQMINSTMLDFSSSLSSLWENEKIAAVESIQIAKEEALTFLSQERERIIRMSHDEAVKELIKNNKIDGRISTINSVYSNNILEM